MTETFEGSYDAKDLRVAVVMSRFNETISEQLLRGALDCLSRHGVPDEKLAVVHVPGAFELPLAVKKVALSGRFDAVVALGVVVRGETAHFEYVAGHSSNSIGQISVDTGIPVTNGILTTDTVQQAADRAGGKMGNKGFEAALAAIEMANLLTQLPKTLDG